MKVSDVRELLKNKHVIDEINRHLWIESQKAGYSIGIERATDEWLRLYSEGWMRFHMPAKYKALQAKKRKAQEKQKKRVIKQALHSGNALHSTAPGRAFGRFGHY